MDRIEQAGIYIAGIYILYSFTSFLYRYILRPPVNLYQQYGNTAIVTGATEGIGKSIAFELGKKRFNLIIISRNQQKLESTKQDILKQYPGITIDICAIDFSKLQQNDLDKLNNIIKSNNYKVGILVNNVGLSYSYPDYLHNLTIDNVQQLIDLNIKSTTYMTHNILQHMISNKRGLVINLSSAAAIVPSPLLAIYGASKQYVDKLTDSLATEYKQYNIKFQVQNPLYVSTSMSKMRPSLTTPTPNTFAHYSVRQFGYSDTHISPYWVHAIMLGVVNRVPKFMANFYINKIHKSIRARALKKLNIQNKKQ